MNIKVSLKNLTKFERLLWLTSILIVLCSTLLADCSNPFYVISSLVGVTALIFVSKGDVLGQVLTLVFSLLYTLVSFSFRYYGEMIICICMTVPLSVMSIVSWARHPYKESSAQVEVNSISKKETAIILLMSVIVTFGFYFVLAGFNTNNLIISTVSIATSFLASALMFRRSCFYAVAYCMNDLILIAMWISASADNPQYVPMVVCFFMFFINDLYGFINWQKIKKFQNTEIKQNN